MPDKTSGTEPQGNEHMNRPGVTNGVPDGTSTDEGMASPSSDRQDTETAPGRAGEDRGGRPDAKR
ncbi:hypothetical protein [Rhizosaccharibacter radicis]|uniref:Uncharacterized protein n=1 Tax=Rhizosaccharibacter radicis TaxID=2782605 RepID=A0ABT1VXB9_9PROT|nr:hypothetical protein [Acetobacteraceae bacterium KSS12]